MSELSLIPREQHNVSRKNMSGAALKVLYGLHEAGFESHLVGGGVRDLLLGGQPKDFDIATNATPEQIQEVFRRCRLIGRRFRIAHVRFGSEVIEVTTFRGIGTADDEDSGDRVVDGDGGRILRDNVFGTLEEDALRRDFTVNALYYSIADFAIRDFAGGFADLNARQLRLIGDPEQRYREDPVRMLRAARLAAKLDFSIEARTLAPIARMAGMLDDIPSARLFDESLKLFMTGHGQRSYNRLTELGLLQHLLPSQSKLSDADRALVLAALASTDDRVAQDKPVTPAFLFAALLWPVFRSRAGEPAADDPDWGDRAADVAESVFASHARRIALPRRFSSIAKEIWLMQQRFTGNGSGRARRLLRHPRFRAAYDFFLLRAAHDPALLEWAERWTQAQEVGADIDRMFRPGPGRTEQSAAEHPTESEGEPAARAPARRRRRRRRPRAPTGAAE
jgi:poly(A) polymerase